MQMIMTALSAFSSRSTRDRRGVLLGYSTLCTLALLGLAHLIAVRATLDGSALDTLQLADLFTMWLLGAALFVIAPSMVAAQVAEERRQGTLDLLRTAPLSPTALTAGFLVGAPGSLYLICAGPLALHVAAGLLGAYPLSVLPVSLLLLALGSGVLMLIAILGALALRRDGGGGAAPIMIIGLSTLACMMTLGMASSPDSAPWAFVHPAGALSVLYQSFDGPFRDMASSSWWRDRMTEPRLAAMLSIQTFFAIVTYSATGVLLLCAARRTLASEPPSRLDKREALGLFSIAALALFLPLRLVTRPEAPALDSLCAVTAALILPYVVCVLGATPSGSARAADPGARRMSPCGSPSLVALLMIGAAISIALVLFDTDVVALFHDREQRLRALAFFALALTLPVYALYSSTRVGSTPGRLAFWAFVAVHLFLQLPAILVVTEQPYQGTAQIPLLLARLDLALGVALPLLLTWRQRVGDRLAARAI